METTQGPSDNKVLLYIGFGALILSILIFFSWFRLDIFTYWQIKFSWLLVIAVLIYYFFLDIRLAVVTSVIMLIVTALMVWIAGYAPTTGSFTIFLVLFIGGLIANFMSGNLKKDKIHSNIKQLVLAPMQIVSDLVEFFKLKKYLGLK